MRTLFLALALALASAAAATAAVTSTGRSTVRNGPLTLFVASGTAGLATLVTVDGSPPTTIQLCPHDKWCGENVSFAWAPGGRRVAYSLDEVGGISTFVGLHVLNVRSGRDTRIPEGAPKTATITNGPTWDPYAKKMRHRVGCFPAAELAWSPDGSSLAYICGPNPQSFSQAAYQLDVLKLRGSGHTTVPTVPPWPFPSLTGNAFWPSWSADGTRIAYSDHLHPVGASDIYTIALDGSNRRFVAGGAAPAWSPDGRTIAYQTTCGIRLVTPSGRDVTPTATANACGAIGVSGPPIWSPDGTQLAVETNSGVYVMDKNGGGLHLVSNQATTTWRGGLPGRPSWRPNHHSVPLVLAATVTGVAASATKTVVPKQLTGRWVGGNALLMVVSPRGKVEIHDLAVIHARFSHVTAYEKHGWVGPYGLVGRLSISGPRSCSGTGTYRWGFKTSLAHRPWLFFTKIHDACQLRVNLFTGTWSRTG